MSPLPTGVLRGNDLVLTRVFDAPIEEVWRSVTASTETARWFGPWERVEGDEGRIRIQLAFEKGAPWTEATLGACEPPRRLVLLMKDDHGAWNLEIALTDVSGATRLELVHHLESPTGIGDIGPGWEYYLDMLVAARAGAALPSFDAYYPAQKAYFLALANGS